VNFLIVSPNEFLGPDRIILHNIRASVAARNHPLKIGEEIAIGVVGKGLGRAITTHICQERVELEITSIAQAEPLLYTSLIVGLSRPQTVRKVLHIASVMGATELHLVKTARSEKSYLQSKCLEPEALQEEIFKGLEQAGNVFPPAVTIHRSFSFFVRERLPQLIQERGSPAPLCLAGHTRSDRPLSELCRNFTPTIKPVFAAIGPEAGWNDEEVEKLAERGFIPLSMGGFVLRVETALTALLAQIALLRALSIVDPES
jgi:16S rRNA (uracil1498-N3)-methyltransferase